MAKKKSTKVILVRKGLLYHDDPLLSALVQALANGVEKQIMDAAKTPPAPPIDHMVDSIKYAYCAMLGRGPLETGRLHNSITRRRD